MTAPSPKFQGIKKDHHFWFRLGPCRFLELLSPGKRRSYFYLAQYLIGYFRSFFTTSAVIGYYIVESKALERLENG
jgi:hypothetical protein